MNTLRVDVAGPGHVLIGYLLAVRKAREKLGMWPDAVRCSTATFDNMQKRLSDVEHERSNALKDRLKADGLGDRNYYVERSDNTLPENVFVFETLNPSGGSPA